MTRALTEDVVLEIVTDISRSLLYMLPERCAVGRVDPPIPVLRARVAIGGARRYEVCVEAPTTLARQLAAAMFGSDPSAQRPDDVRDAFGELANMVAGNCRPLLEGAHHISLPQVFADDERHPTRHSPDETVMTCEISGMPLSVRIRTTESTNDQR